MLNALRKRLIVGVCALLIVTPPSVAYAESFNYVSGAIFYAFDSEQTTGQVARQYNKVWRPVGNQFRLYYQSNGTFDWYNTWANPFTVDIGIDSGYAGCQNDTFNTVSPVTCQTTRP